MTGLYAAVAAVLTLVVAYLWGKATGVKNAKEKHASEKIAGDVRKAVSPAVAETVKKEAEASSDYQHTLKEIENARRNNDMDMMQRIASDLAQKAMSLGAKEAK